MLITRSSLENLKNYVSVVASPPATRQQHIATATPRPRQLSPTQLLVPSPLHNSPSSSTSTPPQFLVYSSSSPQRLHNVSTTSSPTPLYNVPSPLTPTLHSSSSPSALRYTTHTQPLLASDCSLEIFLLVPGPHSLVDQSMFLLSN